MPTLYLETIINASATRCFDLIRDVRIHAETKGSIEVDGESGLGQTVTFNSKLFRMRQRLTVEVTQFEPPHVLVDEMTAGSFTSFKHIHEFIEQDGTTLMKDTAIWTSPFGILGRIVDKLLLENHLKALITRRNAKLKKIAESISG